MLGSQIYACAPQLDGSFAFTRHDVDAHLTDDILHTFVRPLATPIVNVCYEADTCSSTATNVERPATPTCARVA